MYLLFDDKPDVRLGKVHSASAGYFLVNTLHGKQQKIKEKAVIYSWEFALPLETVLPQAEALAKEMDAHFIWDSAPEGEWSASALARDYFGEAPDEATALIQNIALLLRLRAEPIFFRRGVGELFRKAPSEQVEAALAGAERRATLEKHINDCVEELSQNRLPVGWDWANILWRKDGAQTPEQKALAQAAKMGQVTPEELLMACGAFKSWEEFHVLQTQYLDYPDDLNWHSTLTPTMINALLSDVPLSTKKIAVFSIDDHSTDEIDDAFSVEILPDGFRFGIHIAAPALAFDLDPEAVAHYARRITTIYWPGRKWPMMGARHGQSWTDAFSLDAGNTVPVLSLYINTDNHFFPLHHETLCEQVHITHNLRLNAIEAIFNDHITAQNADIHQERLGTINLPDDYPLRDEFVALWRFVHARARERMVQGASIPRGQIDYRFEVMDGRVSITPRHRHAPMDALVAEMMIYANAYWSAQLRDGRSPAIYRVKEEGRVGFSTQSGAHTSMGLACYGWLTSPLRRMVDLCNQRALIAQIRQSPSPLGLWRIGDEPPNDKHINLNALIIQANAITSMAQEFQDKMERYWCLRYLRQTLEVRGQDAVFPLHLQRQMRYPALAFEGLPLLTKLAPSAMEALMQSADNTIQARIIEINEWALTVSVQRV